MENLKQKNIHGERKERSFDGKSFSFSLLILMKTLGDWTWYKEERKETKKYSKGTLKFFLFLLSYSFLSGDFEATLQLLKAPTQWEN